MTQQQIKAMQARIGVVADGFWGPRSIAACKAHLIKRMPSPNPWPATDERSLQRFYGSPGDESQLVNLPVAKYGLFYEGAPVKTVRCHRKVAESLDRILKALWANSFTDVLMNFEGVYNNRSMRGGSLPSLHARGAAIDFMASTNGNQTSWPARATMPLEVMEIFAAEGWTAAGAFWGRDAMHAQSTRP